MGAMEVLDYNITLGKRDRDYEVNEAARMGIENARQLLRSLTQMQAPAVDEECDAMAGAAISKFQKVVSLLSRTGHARFRRRTRDATIAGYAGVFLEISNFFEDNASQETRDRVVSSDYASPSPFTPTGGSSKPSSSSELQRIMYQVWPPPGHSKSPPAISLKVLVPLRFLAVADRTGFCERPGISSKPAVVVLALNLHAQHPPPDGEATPPSAQLATRANTTRHSGSRTAAAGDSVPARPAAKSFQKR
jgi:hypothetical protein